MNADRAAVYGDDCVAVGRVDRLDACRYGVAGADFTVVLYGDSHAAQWFPALEEIALDRGFELVVMLKGGCPTAAVSIPTATLARTCPIWRDQAVALIADEQPELVIVSASAGYPNSDEEWAEGFDATMRRIVPNAGGVVVVGDTPEASHEPTDCLSRNVRDADACASERDDVVASSRLAVEREIADGLGATYVDTTDWLCADAAVPDDHRRHPAVPRRHAHHDRGIDVVPAAAGGQPRRSTAVTVAPQRLISRSCRWCPWRRRPRLRPCRRTGWASWP